MKIICISRGSYSKGKELAENLAGKLGFQCVSREELIEEATKKGIAIGKLETAMLKPHIFNERLALEKEHFQAFSTKYLLEKVLKGNLVYHGRTGHLLLPGITHLLRIRVVTDEEYRIDDVMHRLNLTREKAKTYIENVDEDIHRWVRMYYGVDWHEASHYDVILNLEQMNVENAATALCSLTQLPDFQSTPASRKAIEDLLLASRARVALAEHESTYNSQLTVRADNGVVSVIYQLQQAHVADHIPKVIEKLEGVKDIVCTMAQTNILWVQEKYDPESESFHEMVSLAKKWGAAIELLRLDPVDEESHELEIKPASNETLSSGTNKDYNGGIEDDVEEEDEAADDGGLSRTLTELARMGRSGGGRSVRATPRRLVESVDHTIQYTLLVVGDVFISKGHAARTRMSRELSSLLHDRLKVPVVMIDDLKQQFLFSPKQLVNLFILFAIVMLIYFTVFSNQEPVLKFLHGGTTTAKILAAGGVFVFVPTVAYIYGTATRLLLKLLRIE